MSTGTDSGDEPSGPFSITSLLWLTSAMLKLNRQNEMAPQPLPPGPLIGEKNARHRTGWGGAIARGGGSGTRRTLNNLVPGLEKRSQAEV